MFKDKRSMDKTKLGKDLKQAKHAIECIKFQGPKEKRGVCRSDAGVGGVGGRLRKELMALNTSDKVRSWRSSPNAASQGLKRRSQLSPQLRGKRILKMAEINKTESWGKERKKGRNERWVLWKGRIY